MDREARERQWVEERGEAGWALRAVLVRYGDVARVVAERLGLSPTDVSALEHLLGDPSLGPVQIGQRLGITSAAATALVDRLERAGHVVRRAHPEDRRRRVLEVTPHALAENLRVLAPLFEALAALEAGFDNTERAAVVRYLRGVVAVYDAFVAPGDP